MEMQMPAALSQTELSQAGTCMEKPHAASFFFFFHLVSPPTLWMCNTKILEYSLTAGNLAYIFYLCEWCKMAFQGPLRESEEQQKQMMKFKII